MLARNRSSQIRNAKGLYEMVFKIISGLDYRCSKASIRKALAATDNPLGKIARHAFERHEAK